MKLYSHIICTKFHCILYLVNYILSMQGPVPQACILVMASSPVRHVLLAAIKINMVQTSATSVTMVGLHRILEQHLPTGVVS